MKRFLLCVATLVLLLGGSQIALRADAIYTEVEYEIRDGEAIVTGAYMSGVGKLVIPDTLGGCPVTEIAAYAFANNSKLNQIVIPDSVHTIGDQAFFWCDMLYVVTMGSGVQYIGERAFHYCNNVSTLNLPEGLKTIGPYAFYGSGLTEINIPASVESIGNNAFEGCMDLTQIQVAEENQAYSSDDRGVLFNKNKTTLICAPGAISGNYTVPDSVTAIVDYAISNCNLTELHIGSGVTEIGVAPAYGNYYLTGIWVDEANPAYCSDDRGVLYTKDKLFLVQAPCNLQGSYTMAEETAKTGELSFFGTRLDEVIIGENVQEIGEFSFGQCGLESITIPDSVQVIETEAFYNCGLRTVHIGLGLRYVGYMAFQFCEKITDVYYAGRESQWAEIVFDSNNADLTRANIHFAVEMPEFPDVPDVPGYTYVVHYGEAWITGADASVTGDVQIPEVLGGRLVTRIRNEAFADRQDITSVIIPDSVERLGEYAFAACDRLRSVTLGNSVSEVGMAAFAYCNNLCRVSFGSSVTNIGEAAFYSNSLDFHVYYAGTRTQWEQTFVDGYNESLNRAIFHFESEMPDDPLLPIPEDTPGYQYELFMGEAIITDYDISYGTDPVLPTVLGGCPVTAVGDGAFFRMDITSVVIPKGVRTIGDHAFNDCRWLKTVTLPDSVTTIGQWAFSCNENLIEVNLGNGVTTIGDHAFQQCRKLTEIFFPASLTDVGAYAFDGCNHLEKYLVDENNPTYSADEQGVLFSKDKTVLVRLPQNFSGCYTLPEGIARIADNACGNCVSLTALTLPESLQLIGDYAFHSCYALKEIYLPADVRSIGKYAFDYCSSLTDVYYGGTQDQWQSVFLGEHNEPLTGATIHYESQRPEEIVAPGELDGVEGVSEDDAIYLLQSILMPELFPVEQDVDFDGNGTVNEDDAIYLLQHVLMPNMFPLG